MPTTVASFFDGQHGSTIWLGLLVTLAGTVNAPAQEPNPVIQKAIEASRNRQTAIKTIELRISVTDFVAKGGRTAALPPSLAKRASSTPIPAEDKTLSYQNIFCLDGTRFRYEDHKPVWQMNTGAFTAALSGSLLS